MSGIDQYTKLLLHMDGADESTSFIDSSGNNVILTPAGNAQIDTAQSKFGGAACLFDGDGDRLTGTLPSAPGTGDFCFDGWMRLTGAGSYNSPFGLGVYSSGNCFLFQYWNNGRMILYVNGNNVLDSYPTYHVLDLNTWHHFASLRISGVLYLFINGVYIMSVGNSSSITATDISIGARPLPDGDYINGHLDEFRVSIGGARINDASDPLYISSGVWSDGFTPPTVPYKLDVELINKILNRNVSPVDKIPPAAIVW